MTPSRPPARGAKPTAAPRRRRTSEEARREILDVAEARFRARGPAALRLQEIASEVGVSHPTILHHFGSREGLIREVIRRGLDGLQAELITALAERDPARIDVVALIERVFDVLGEHGQARMLAWVALSQDGGGEESLASGAGPFLRSLGELVHAHQRALWQSRGETAPPFEDSLFVVMLAATALIGDAILGRSIRASSGLAADPDAAHRFRTWLAGVLVGHLDGGASAKRAQ